MISTQNISEYLAPDCNSVAEFIVENLKIFAEQYNKELIEGEKHFSATFCELSIPVYVTTSEQNGVYLDFDGNNGYMIVVDGYSVVAFETSGDLEYLKNLDSAYYSIYDGFVYYDEENNIVPYEFNKMTEADWKEYSQVELEKSYDGQSDKGNDGEIYNTKAYVYDKYGSGYTVYETKTLSNYTYVSQYDLSLYYKQKNNASYSERNCSLSSIYSLLNYFKTKGKCPSFPSSSIKTVYYPSKDSFYKKYVDKGNYYIPYSKSMPQFYLDVREVAVLKHGYEVSGTNPFNISEIIKAVGAKYGYKFNPKHILVWSYESQVVNEIKSGYPTIWNMANSSTYGSHTTVVTGYKTYRKTKNVLGIKIHSYVQLLALNDNWNTHAVYFDLTLYVLQFSIVDKDTDGVAHTAQMLIKPLS